MSSYYSQKYSVIGCDANSIYTCAYPNCDRALCSRHSIDLETPLRDHPESTARIRAEALAGHYCQEHGEAVGRQMQAKLRASTIAGYFTTFVKMIMSLIWEMVKLTGRTIDDVLRNG